jgi:hypothetical protein
LRWWLMQDMDTLYRRRVPAGAPMPFGTSLLASSQRIDGKGLLKFRSSSDALAGRSSAELGTFCWWVERWVSRY